MKPRSLEDEDTSETERYIEHVHAEVEKIRRKREKREARKAAQAM